MKKKEKITVANLIDWSISFVDPDGSFYCGTTETQKENAAVIINMADLVIDTVDLHPVNAPEHAINGGLYPVHNAVNPEQYAHDFIYALDEKGNGIPLGNKSLSPHLTHTLAKAVGDRKTGILVPKGVYFQGEGPLLRRKPFCKPSDIEQTFKHTILTKEEFLKGNHGYIIAPKHYFDATRVDSDITLPAETYPGIPTENFNVYGLLKLKYPEDMFELSFVNTGVVEGICRLHTSIGLKQMFPESEIINISDATTPLYGVGLGYETANESRNASMQVCRDIGIRYMTTKEYLQLAK